MMNLPPAVVENVRNGETVFFVGSGFSLSAGFPSSASIAAVLARKMSSVRKSIDPAAGLDKVAELYETVYGRAGLVTEVASFLRTAPEDIPSASHRLLASLVKHGFVKTIVTTNYDTLIEDACDLLGVSITVIAHESQLHSAAGSAAVLYKIHGDFSHPELLVLTPSDLQGWNRRPETRPIVAQLQALFDKNALLFLGYSLSDFNILALLLGSEFSTRGAPRLKRFAAVHTDDALPDVAMRLRQYNVDAFQCSDMETFLRELLVNLPVKLRIKHLVFNYPSWYPDQLAQYGGIETFIGFLTKYHDDFVHETASVYSRPMLSSSPWDLAHSTFPTYPASFYFFRAAAKSALESLKGDRQTESLEMPDVLHVHFLAFGPMCEETGIPTVCTSHSLLSLDLAFTKGLFDGDASPGARHEIVAAYAAERAAATDASFVTVVSSAHEQEVRNMGARSVQRLEAPFDVNVFELENPPSARRRAGLPEKYTITYVGRPDRRKGIEILIRACELLADTQCDFQLVLVGYGFQKRKGVLEFGAGRFWFDTSTLEKKDIGIELKMANSYWEHAGLLYKASDVVVVPSIYEPLGYVVLEAMACGRPVVAARTGGIVETITDGVNGILFEPGNAEELAQKLSTLRADPDLGKLLGQRARKDLESRRAIQDIVHDWHQIYRQAAFAFGESLYPPLNVLNSIRSKAERVVEERMLDKRAPFTEVSAVAVAGCSIAEEVIIEQGSESALPQGVPIDTALLRAIALELHRAFRRQGVKISFSNAALCDVMNDLALALLNRDRKRRNLLVRAEDTKQRLSSSWFQDVVGLSDDS